MYYLHCDKKSLDEAKKDINSYVTLIKQYEFISEYDMKLKMSQL